MHDKTEIKALYQKMIDGWNTRSAHDMAGQFTESGESIGFDGSLMSGQDEMISQLSAIFHDHPTPPFVTNVKEVRFVGEDTAILRAIVGMVPPGQTELNPELNAYQTIVAAKQPKGWKIELLQNTPAQYHGRPDLVQEITEELKSEM
ncbi:SgcJ/EcaC family oxidoreductase [Virgibacillus sp. L01]|uniref:SgcJ/EcaC family oxidoreductase n=1 Tax=Virgibacillus sp. L01 TaxID=3457429 RepID=UPI003FD14461